MTNPVIAGEPQNQPMNQSGTPHLVVPHPLSWTAVLTTMQFNKQPLAICTSFIYKKGAELFLVTNWHNMTGRHPDTKKAISQHGNVFPNVMEVCFPLQTEPIQWHHCLIKICKEDFSDPEWYEHPVHGGKIDVAVMPVSFESGFPAPPQANPINDFNFSDFSEGVGDEVFILGYPKGKTGGGALPIWKRGSIATEPDVDLDQLPKLLVDTASRQGMSGSPVIVRNFGMQTVAQNSDGSVLARMGHSFKFLGIYSGRLFADKPLSAYFPGGQVDKEAAAEAMFFEAQLRIVWKAAVIDEIIEAKKKPDPFA